MVKRTYAPFKDTRHFVDWAVANCVGCKRLKLSTLPDRFPEVERCTLFETLSNHREMIDRDTAFLIGFADMDGGECGNRIWPCFSKIDRSEATSTEQRAANT